MSLFVDIRIDIINLKSKPNYSYQNVCVMKCIMSENCEILLVNERILLIVS